MFNSLSFLTSSAILICAYMHSLIELLVCLCLYVNMISFCSLALSFYGKYSIGTVPLQLRRILSYSLFVLTIHFRKLLNLFLSDRLF